MIHKSGSRTKHLKIEKLKKKIQAKKCCSTNFLCSSRRRRGFFHLLGPFPCPAPLRPLLHLLEARHRHPHPLPENLRDRHVHKRHPLLHVCNDKSNSVQHNVCEVSRSFQGELLLHNWIKVTFTRLSHRTNTKQSPASYQR